MSYLDDIKNMSDKDFEYRYDMTKKVYRAIMIDEMDAHVAIYLEGKSEYTGCSGVRYLKKTKIVKGEFVPGGAFGFGGSYAEGGEITVIDSDWSGLKGDDEINLPKESWFEALYRLEYDLRYSRPFEWDGDSNEMCVGSTAVDYEIYVVNHDESDGLFAGYLNKNFSASGEYACHRPSVGKVREYFTSDEAHDPRDYHVLFCDMLNNEDVLPHYLVPDESRRGAEPGPADPKDMIRKYA